MSNVTLGKVAILKRETFYVDGVEVAWIPGYEERYAISKDGQVWTNQYIDKAGKTRKPKWLHQVPNSEGYINLTLNGKDCWKLHRLLALTWIYNPDKVNRTEVDHENRIRDDNRVENLRWLTDWENRLNGTAGGTEVGVGKTCSNWWKRKQADETPEERRARLDHKNELARAKRAAETPEEKEERRARQREYQRQNRARKKAEAQAQAEAGE